MTTLNRPVRRSTANATVFERGHRRIVVTLHPGDCIGLRLERTRREYLLPLADVYQIAAARTILRARADFDRRVKVLVKSGLNRRQAKKQARQETR